MSLNTLCLLIREIFYLIWPLLSIFWSSVWVYFVVQKRKVTVDNYVTTLWITLPFHLAVQWIQAQLHRKIYMKHPKHTFNIHSCKTFQTSMNFSTCIHSLEKSPISKGLILGKYPQNNDCLKLNLVQVHISNSFQCISKHKLFKLTNGHSSALYHKTR